jgi:hypothetical protein
MTNSFRVPIGTRVKVAESLSRRDFTPEAVAERVPGARGRIVDYSDGHGLCYSVQHEDGTSGYYDPDELLLPGGPPLSSLHEVADVQES